MMYDEGSDPSAELSQQQWWKRVIGAYGGGNGRIFVKVKYRWFPIIEREVYVLSPSYATKETHNFLEWVDNDTLLIHETGETIKPGIVSFHTPLVVTFPVLLILMLFRIVVGFV